MSAIHEIHEYYQGMLDQRNEEIDALRADNERLQHFEAAERAATKENKGLRAENKRLRAVILEHLDEGFLPENARKE